MRLVFLFSPSPYFTTSSFPDAGGAEDEAGREISFPPPPSFPYHFNPPIIRIEEHEETCQNLEGLVRLEPGLELRKGPPFLPLFFLSPPDFLLFKVNSPSWKRLFFFFFFFFSPPPPSSLYLFHRRPDDHRLRQPRFSFPFFYRL